MEEKKPPEENWFSVVVALCLEPARAWHFLRARMHGVRGGGLIVGTVGVAVVLYFIWQWIHGDIVETSYTANNNTNSNIIQGSPNAIIYPPHDLQRDLVSSVSVYARIDCQGDHLERTSHYTVDGCGGGVAAVFKNNEVLLSASDTQHDSVLSGPRSGFSSIVCAADPASSIFGKPMASLLESTSIRVYLCRGIIADDSRMTGGQIILTVNGIRLSFDLPSQEAVIGSVNNAPTKMYLTTELKEGLRPLLSTPDK